MALTGTKRNDGKVSTLWCIENDSVSLRQPKWYLVLKLQVQQLYFNAGVYIARDIGNPSLLRHGKGIKANAPIIIVSKQTKMFY